ncbi:MAG: putative rane protein [Nocardioides sp.]|nr:putative rane protein [Nocardioides sp.]
MNCRYAQLDGSYVLGALSPAERQEFEHHLGGCVACAQAVRELAGLPGLLARVDPLVLESPPTGEPVPETLLPALVRQIRRTQRRRTLVTAGLAAAAAVVVAIGLLGVTGALDDDRAPTASPTDTTTGPVGQTMVPVGQTTVAGSLAFESVAWGTRLDLTCTYAHGGEGYEPAHTDRYALFVHTLDGRTEQVATWRALPGRTMRLAAATAASRADIASVEVRTVEGELVLKLTT